MKKAIVTVLCAVFAFVMFGSFFGCSDYIEKIDKDKTQLYIGTFDGGYGDAWLYAAAKRFEERYKDYSFEEGKKGIQIMISKDVIYKGNTLINNISSLTQEVFFTEGVDYYEMVNKGLLLDITDVYNSSLQYDFVTKQINTDNEDKTVKEKMMLPKYAEYLVTDDHKFYALPFYNAFYGIVYDVDLFEEENLYFAAEGYGDSKGFVRSPSEPRSKGPDGQAGTLDDGLPATYDNFFKLCDRIVQLGLTPITWAGAVQEYMSYFLSALALDYDGVENTYPEYYFQGQVNLVTGFDAGGNPIIETKYVPKKESYLINNRRVGKYFALTFLERLIDNRKYYNEIACFGTDVTHLMAQQNFLNGRFIANRDRIAMLIDGSWWMNEASGAFELLERTYGKEASKQDRRFGIMPLPKATPDKVGEKYTVSNQGASYAFIKSNIAPHKINLAKAFLQFCHTNESLCEFTKITSATRPFIYTFSDEEYQKLPYYAKVLYQIQQTSDCLVPYVKDPDFQRNNAKVGYMWMTRINNNDYAYPSRAIYNNNFSARQVFEGLSNYYTPERWENLYGPFGG